MIIAWLLSLWDARLYQSDEDMNQHFAHLSTLLRAPRSSGSALTRKVFNRAGYAAIIISRLCSIVNARETLSTK